jgi:hypothetical protein
MTIVISRILIGSVALGLLPLNAMADSDVHNNRRQTASGALHAAAHREQIVRREKPNSVHYRVSGGHAPWRDDRAFDRSILGSAPNMGIDDYCDLPSTGCSTRY